MGYRKAPNPKGETTVAHNSILPCHSEGSVSPIIDDVQPTSETLTGRAGLSLFVRYVRGIGLYPHLDRLVCVFRANRPPNPEQTGRVGAKRRWRLIIISEVAGLSQST